jgi:hypothetical protein
MMQMMKSRITAPIRTKSVCEAWLAERKDEAPESHATAWGFGGQAVIEERDAILSEISKISIAQIFAAIVNVCHESRR